MTLLQPLRVSLTHNLFNVSFFGVNWMESEHQTEWRKGRLTWVRSAVYCTLANCRTLASSLTSRWLTWTVEKVSFALFLAKEWQCIYCRIQLVVWAWDLRVSTENAACALGLRSEGLQCAFPSYFLSSCPNIANSFVTLGCPTLHCPVCSGIRMPWQGNSIEG